MAYHESGHALLGVLMEDFDVVGKVSIIPRGQSGGATIFIPEEESMDSGLYTKEFLLNKICVALGGRAAEEIVNGKELVTTGAQGDLAQTTNFASRMVKELGMSDIIGPRSISTAKSGQMSFSMSNNSSECTGSILQ